MIALDDYLRLLPKTELHCHFVSTMSATTLVRLAEREGVALPTTDPAALFDYTDLTEFLAAFRAAHVVLRERGDFAEVAYHGVRLAAGDSALRYREYAVNPQYFADLGLDYRLVLDSIIDGLRAAELDFGVGFRIVVAINRRASAASAVELVERMIADPLPEVAALGMDDLTPEGAEDPGRFAEAMRLARSAGLKTTAHVGETDAARLDDIRVVLDELRVDRIDHGYRIADDPVLLQRVVDEGIALNATPISTTICSGWTLDPDHRIARLIRAGANVTISTDDDLFFRTDLAREYREGLVALGVDAATARRLALNGIEAAFCSEEEKAALRARFAVELQELDAALEPSSLLR